MNELKTRKGEETIEYRNKHFYVYSQEVDFGSFSKKYYSVKHGTKACLLIDNHDSILLSHQYRFLIDHPVWEIPGGGVEEGEDPCESAVRECEEETGIRGLNVKPLINYPQGLDCLNAGARLFYTTEFKQVNGFKPNPAEVDMIKWVPYDQCMEMVRMGKIVDHFTIIALLYYQYAILNKGVRR